MGITAQGRALIARTKNGEQLTFTKIKIGTGVLPGGQTEASRTSLVNFLKDVPITSAYLKTPEQFNIKVLFSNEGLTEAKRITEQGIYAKIGNEAEVLYAYFYLTNGFIDLPVPTGDRYIKSVKEFGLKTSDTGNAQVVIDGLIVHPTIEDMNREVSRIDNTLNDLENTKANKTTLTSELDKKVHKFESFGNMTGVHKSIVLKDLCTQTGTVTGAIEVTHDINFEGNVRISISNYSGNDLEFLFRRFPSLVMSEVIVLSKGVDVPKFYLFNNKFYIGETSDSYMWSTIKIDQLSIKGNVDTVSFNVNVVTIKDSGGTEIAPSLNAHTLQGYKIDSNSENALWLGGTIYAKIVEMKNLILGGAAGAYDTLKELQDLLTSGVSGLDALLTKIGLKVDKSAYTAQNDILVGTGPSSFIKKTPEEIRTILNVQDGANKIPLGSVIVGYFTVTPTGYVKPNTYYSKTAFPKLYAQLLSLGFAPTHPTIADLFATPILNGEFLRFLDDGRGVDPSRTTGSFQDQMVLLHGHEYTRAFSGSNNTMWHSNTTEAISTGSDNITNTLNGAIKPFGGTENRPRNVALPGLIKADD